MKPSRKRCDRRNAQRRVSCQATKHPKGYVLNDFLDPEDPIQDAIDAERDAHSVRYLAERSRKMAEQGNGWRHTISHELFR